MYFVLFFFIDHLEKTYKDFNRVMIFCQKSEPVETLKKVIKTKLNLCAQTLVHSESETTAVLVGGMQEKKITIFSTVRTKQPK